MTMKPVVLLLVLAATTACFGLHIHDFLKDAANREPESDAKYSNESYATEYMQLLNLKYLQLEHICALTRWNFKIDMTSENEKKIIGVCQPLSEFTVQNQDEANKFRADLFPYPLKRQFKEFTHTMSSKNASLNRLRTEILNSMGSMYSSALTCMSPDKCLPLIPDVINLVGESRDPEVLKKAWTEWRKSTAPMKEKYVQFVNASNVSARENGFSDYSQFSRESEFYETPELDSMLQRIWSKINPLYKQLHAYVRRKLREKYGRSVVGEDGTIPAHLLGNMWAQHWQPIYDLVAPYPEDDTQGSLEKAISEKAGIEDIVKMAEQFFVSIGLFPMTRDFWEHSIFERKGRNMVCHASASNLFHEGMFRIKMCAEGQISDFSTAHHEMGHIEYFMAYSQQPPLLRSGANAAFHEAIGDTIQLSATTGKHLKMLLGQQSKQEGRLHRSSLGDTPRERKDAINTLMKKALAKVSFLPFGYLVDLWRWGVMQGKTPPGDYNRRWWELRLKYQGVRAPVPRSEEDFDPGAKFHIPYNSPYIDYFVSFVMQFQLYEAMCRESGFDETRPLHECDFYGSKEAGAKLRKMLSRGMSQPWQEQLREMVGVSTVTTDAILKYFKLLQDWLEEDNAAHGEKIGWDGASINWI